VSDRPIAFAGDGFEIVAHESEPAQYPEESHPTIQVCVPMFGARYWVTREAETGAALEQDFGARDILLVPAGILAGRLALISSFDPEAPFSVGNAMARNRWIMRSQIVA
jgi:hypothetical protein